MNGMERQTLLDRRRVMPKSVAWPAALAGALLLLGCSGDPDGDRPPTGLEEGEAAVWSLPRDVALSTSGTSFPAGVQRLACNSGVTGEVLEPSIQYDETQVIVTFTVETANNGGNADCQANDTVQYDVQLDEPIGNRELVDGECLPGGEAEGSSGCERGGVKWQSSLALDARWACDQDHRSVFIYDRGSPPRGVTLDDVRRRTESATPGASAVVLTRTEEDATVRLLDGAGLVLAELTVTRWPNHSWAVDSGTRCRGARVR